MKMVGYDTSVLSWIASFAWIFFILTIWEGVWKGIALWKSGKNKQLPWFVCIFIFNTLGILPIIYLLWFQKKNASRVQARKPSKSKSRSRSRKR